MVQVTYCDLDHTVRSTEKFKKQTEVTENFKRFITKRAFAKPTIISICCNDQTEDITIGQE